jgi:hypothetical protein
MRVYLGDAGRRYALRAGGEVSAQHARREDRDAVTPRHGAANQVCVAEYEQRFDRKVGDTLNDLALRVGLLEKSGIGEYWINPAAVGFRFDRDQSAWPDENVIDVAATGRRVVDCQPAVGAQAVDDRADMLFAERAAMPGG